MAPVDFRRGVLYMKLNDISTPALVVFKEVFEKNADEMAKILEGSSLKLRPHFKSHKCAAIAKLQIAAGAVGVTCAKLDEALDLADAGVEDILIANQITDKAKISRLAHLASTCHLSVCVDSKDNVSALEAAAAQADSTIFCLIEYEIGMQRCGVAKNEDVLALIRQIEACPHLVYDGIQAYAGHISHTVSIEERRDLTKANTKKIRALISYLKENGKEPRILSGGSTGTSVIKAKDNLYTELQAGSYLFMDATYDELKLPFKSSLFILTTVVSVNDRLVVVDAGVKSCGVDQGMPVPVGFSVSEVVASEEHFQLHHPTKKFSVGDKILLVPAHCCSTVNLHEKLYFIEDGKVSDRLTVTARGAFH